MATVLKQEEEGFDRAEAIDFALNHRKYLLQRKLQPEDQVIDEEAMELTN